MKLHVVVLFLSSVVILSGVAQGWQQSTGNSADVWGGRGVTMRMSAQGATLEFDCAHGSVTQPIKPDPNGKFSASGTYTAERGGPVLKANRPHDTPAVYRGVITGDTMRLEIVVSDQDQSPAPLTLSRGNAGRLVKCR